MALVMGTTLEIQTSKPNTKTKTSEPVIDQAAKAHQDFFELMLAELIIATQVPVEELFVLADQEMLQKYAFSSNQEQQQNVQSLLTLRNTQEGIVARNNLFEEAIGRQPTSSDDDASIKKVLRDRILRAKMEGARRKLQERSGRRRN